MARHLPAGQSGRQLPGCRHVPRGEPTAAWPTTPGVGPVQTALWSAPKASWPVAGREAFLSLGRAQAGKTARGQGFWADGTRQRLRTLTKE